MSTFSTRRRFLRYTGSIDDTSNTKLMITASIASINFDTFDDVIQ